MTPNPALYRAVYEFHKRHLASIELMSAPDWPTILADMRAIEESFSDTPFAGELLAVVVEELERHYNQ